jgi:AraC-like DNA-binding protein
MKIPQVKFNPKNHKDIGIEIIELSEIYKRSEVEEFSFIAKPHRINFHNLLYITQGKGTHFIDFNTYSVKESSAVFINKNQIHSFDLINKPQGKLIIFTDDFLDRISFSMKTTLFAPNHLLTLNSSAFTLPSKTKNTCDALLTEITKEYQLKDPSLYFLNLLFSAVLAKLNTARPSLSDHYLSDSRTKKFKLFIRLLEENYTRLRDAKNYAEMLHMTYKSLNELCKLTTNQTAKQLIDAHTILEAKRKLCIENMQIQQLSDQLGFDEVTNFVKYFKKNTLLTPTQFKKSLKG